MVTIAKDYHSSMRYFLDAYGVCCMATGCMIDSLDKLEATHGKQAIVDLAGAIQYFQRNNNSKAIKEVISHDLSIAGDEHALPRSHGYGKYFVAH